MPVRGLARSTAFPAVATSLGTCGRVISTGLHLAMLDRARVFSLLPAAAGVASAAIGMTLIVSSVRPQQHYHPPQAQKAPAVIVPAPARTPSATAAAAITKGPGAEAPPAVPSKAPVVALAQKPPPPRARKWHTRAWEHHRRLRCHRVLPFLHSSTLRLCWRR